MEGKLTKLLTSTGRVHWKFSIICKLRQLTFLICSVAADHSLLCPPFPLPVLYGQDIHFKDSFGGRRTRYSPPVPLLCTIQGVMSYHNTEGSVGVIKIKILGFMVVLCNHAKLLPLYGKLLDRMLSYPFQNTTAFLFRQEKWTALTLWNRETVTWRIWLDCSNSRLESLKPAFQEKLSMHTQ